MYIKTKTNKSLKKVLIAKSIIEFVKFFKTVGL